MPSGNDCLALLMGQRQHREFTSESVSDDDLHALLGVMRATGSAGNKQPWHFIVMRDPATKTALSRSVDSMNWLAQAPLVLVVVTEGSKATNMHDLGRIDERILLGAQALGLGAGIVSFWNAEAKAHGREVLQLPDEWTLFSAVGVGHPVGSVHGSGKANRKSLDELVSRDRFSLS